VTATCFTRSCLDAREHRQEWESLNLTQAWKDHLRTCCLLLKPESRRHLMLLLQFLHDIIHNQHLKLAVDPRYNSMTKQVGEFLLIFTVNPDYNGPGYNGLSLIADLEASFDFFS
jgi:hypothetical protein